MLTTDSCGFQKLFSNQLGFVKGKLLEILTFEILDSCGTLNPKMNVTKAFLPKMTLGHNIRKIDHSFRIRSQKSIWRPREPAQCLLDVTSYHKSHENVRKFAISQISKSLILDTFVYFVKQNFLRHIPIVKFASLQYFGDTMHFGGF